jgi:hypothetical protein
MSADIVKHLRFRDEYNSKTLNAKDAWIYGKNGLVRGGDISLAGLSVTIQPFVFVQNGMVVEKLTPLTLTIPGGSDLLNRRHFIGVNVANNIENNAEVLGAVFIARPEDYNDTVVLVAEYDLVEYRKLPFLSISEGLVTQSKNNVVGARSGINNGFQVANTPALSSTYVIDRGVLTDKTGRVIEKTQSESFSVAPVDADFPNRIDQIVYRVPVDSVNRVGSVELLTGDATKIGVGADSKIVIPSLSSFAKSTTKVFTPRNIPNHQFLFIDDTSSNSVVKYFKRSDDLTSQPTVGIPAGATAIGPALVSYDAVCDSNGLMFIFGVYALNNTQMRFNRMNASGVLTGSDIVTARSGICKSPKILANMTKSVLYYFWLEFYGGFYEIKFMRTDLVGNEISAPVTLQAASGLGIDSFDADVDNEDDIMYVSYQSDNKVYLKKFDLGSGNSLTPPNLFINYGDITDNTAFSTSLTPFSGSASNPKVKIADNKEVYVLFHQVYDGVKKALVAYNSRYKSEFGFKSLFPSAYPGTTNSQSFDIFVSTTNYAHIFENIGSSGSSSLFNHKLDLYTLEKEFSSILSSDYDFKGMSLLKNKSGVVLGSFIQNSSALTFISNGSPQAISSFGPGVYNGQAMTSQQFLIDRTVADSLPRLIAAGDQFIVGNIPVDPNNGVSGVISNISVVTILGNDFYLCTTSHTFTYSTTSIVSQFQYPSSGESLKVVKSIAAVNTTDLISTKEVATDVWIARVNMVSDTSPPSLTKQYLFNKPDFFGANQHTRNLYELISLDLTGGGLIQWDNTPSTFQWSSDIKIFSHGRKNYHRIAAGSVVIPEGSLAYVTLPDLPQPTIPLTVQVIDSEVYTPDRNGVRNLVLMYRNANILHSKYGPFSLQPGEESTGGFGQTIPQDVLTFIGSNGETDAAPNYIHENYVSDGDSLVAAISVLDAQLAYISNLKPLEEKIVVLSSTYTVTATTLIWDPLNTEYDIVVTKNGQRMSIETTALSLDPLTTEDYRKISATQITFAKQLISGDKIIIRRENAGSNLGNNTAKLNGIVVASALNKFNFVGGNWTIANASNGQVNISVSGGGGGGGGSGASLTKMVYNNTGATVPANAAVAWVDDGSITLADSNSMAVSDFAGITQTSIPNNSYGPVYKSGAAPFACIGLGATPGQKIYLGEVPGALQLNAPAGLTDTVLIVGRAEPPDNVWTGSADDLFIELQIVSEG